MEWLIVYKLFDQIIWKIATFNARVPVTFYYILC